MVLPAARQQLPSAPETKRHLTKIKFSFSIFSIAKFVLIFNFELVLMCFAIVIRFMVTEPYQYCGNRTLPSLNITAVANSCYKNSLHFRFGKLFLFKNNYLAERTQVFYRKFMQQQHVSNYRELRKSREISQGLNSYFLFFD